jgi:hypothetical protein
MMKRCTVSIVDASGQAHTVEVEASSVFDAAAQATHGWAKLWWYAPDAVIEVCAGEEVWRVRAERVRQWTTARCGINRKG